MIYGSDQHADTVALDTGWKEDLRLVREELNWTDLQTKAYLRDNLAGFLGRV